MTKQQRLDDFGYPIRPKDDGDEPQQDPHDRVVELVEESQEMSLDSDRLDLYEAAIRELSHLYAEKKTELGVDPCDIAEELHDMTQIGG